MEDLTLIPLVAIVALALLMRNLEGSWLAPGAFFGLYWSGFLSATYVLLPSFTLMSSGVGWIAGAYVALIVGVLLAQGRGATGGVMIEGLPRQQDPGEARWLLWLVPVCAFVAIGATPVLTAAAGVPVSDLAVPDQFLQVAGYYTTNRYNDPGFREPSLGIALFSFAYLGAILGGRLFALRRTFRARLAALLPLAAAAFLSMLMTTRALVLLSLLLWITGYLVSQPIGASAGLRLLSMRKMALAASVSGVAVALYVGGQVVRAGGSDNIARDEMYTSVATSFLGSTSTFTTWFADTSGGQLAEYGWGRRTLSGPVNWLLPGFDRSSVSTFDPIIVGGGNSEFGEDTTVATLFREWIFDFTPVGSLILMFALGVFGAWSYGAARREGTRRCAGLASYYLIVLYSMMGFVYKFTTLAAVSLAFLLYCRFVGARFSGPGSLQIARRPE
jgi:oligosaccharide repeat unit polymerase